MMQKKTAGYTFIEILVAIGIFSMLLTMTTVITVNFYNAQKRERIRNATIEETQFLLNRIANLIRDNAIDYSEYYSNNLEETGGGTAYAQDAVPENDDREDIVYGNEPKEYEHQFFFYPTCDPGEKHGDGNCDRDDPNAFNEGTFSTEADNDIGNDAPDASALYGLQDSSGTAQEVSYLQRELYLISPSGTTKTVLRRIGNGIDDDVDGDTDEDDNSFWQTTAEDGGEQLGILQLDANSDVDSDGELDFLSNADDFQADGDTSPEVEDFIAISPRNIDIVDLKFYISPLDDPRKAFSETGKDNQIQPHVTILLTTRPGVLLRRQMVGTPFTLSVQTTISQRHLQNVLLPAP